MVNDSQAKKRRFHPIWTFVIIILVFALPYFGAKLMFTEHAFPKTRVNKGHLITPPMQITAFKLYNSKGQLMHNQAEKVNPPPSATRTTGKWVLLTVAQGHCNKVCEKSLYNSRQIRIATNKRMNRIERVLLTFGNSNYRNPALKKLIAGPYRGTIVLHTNRAAFERISKQEVKVPYHAASGTLYIVDPLGNMMMVYKPGVKPEPIFKDVERLLKVSQIG